VEHPRRKQKSTPSKAPRRGAPSSIIGLLDRLFGSLDGDVPGTEISKLRAFEFILLLIVATEPWTRLLRAPGGVRSDVLLPALLTSLIAAAALLPGYRRVAFAALAALQIQSIWSGFPERGNHAYLEAGFLTLGAGLDLDDEEDRLLHLRAVRWMVCVIFFYAGLQKLMQGYYSQGQYLAFALSKESYQWLLRPLLEPAEYQRLVSLHGKIGDGPYLVASPLFVAVSNLTWMAEIALVPLFVIRRTRVAAVVAALVLILAIEIGARELFFGFVYTNAVLLLLPGDFNRRLVLPCAAAMAALLLIRIGILPEMTFY